MILVIRKRTILLFLVGFIFLYIIYLAWPRPIPEKIIQSPNSHLITRSEEVALFNNEVNDISSELHDVLKKIDRRGQIFGLGMSAPQLGYNKRIIAIKQSYGNYKTMINPKIVEQKWRLPWIEGCFSVEGMHFTKRYYWNRIRYQDIQGNYHEEVIRGMPTIIQQEIDHLNGVLISD